MSLAWRATGLWLGVAAVLFALSYVDANRKPRGVDASLRGRPIGVAEVETLDRDVMSTADWTGRLTLVNFWATWCKPCLVEIPDLIALQNAFPDELRIVGLATDEPDLDRLREFVAKAGLNYPIANATQALTELFPEIAALPTSFLIDEDGRFAGRIVGRIDPDTIRTLLRTSQAAR